MIRKFIFIRIPQKIRNTYVKFQASLTGVCVCARARPCMRAISHRCTALLCAETRWCLTRSTFNGQMGPSEVTYHR
jgi:hypothetical protein